MALRFEETVPQKTLAPVRPATLHTWGSCATHLLGVTALSTFACSGLFTFLASSSFTVMMRVPGLRTVQYGLVMFASSFLYPAGHLLCRRLLGLWGIRRTVADGQAAEPGGASAMAAGLERWGAIGLGHQRRSTLFMVAHGIPQPAGRVRRYRRFPSRPGRPRHSMVSWPWSAPLPLASGNHLDGTVGPLVYGIAFWACSSP